MGSADTASLQNSRNCLAKAFSENKTSIRVEILGNGRKKGLTRVVFGTAVAPSGQAEGRVGGGGMTAQNPKLARFLFRGWPA